MEIPNEDYSRVQKYTVCNPFSSKIIRRRLRELGNKSCVPVKQPFISKIIDLKSNSFKGCIFLGALTNGKI